MPEGNGLNDKLAGSELINLHWVSWLVDLPGLVSSVGGKTPIVWTLHDMNPMTGGCHYDGGCGLYARACGSCPQLRNPGAKDASHEIFAIRKKAIDRLSEKDLHVVVLCKWMADKVRQSPILGRFPCTVMPNGIDTDVFFPIPRPSARESLGISHEKETLLFVAETVTNHRKGFDLLQKAVITLADRGRQIQLLSVGRGDVSGLTSAGIDLVNIGLVTNEHFMRVLYSAADLFVIPSREDNLPNTVMESIACGTPVVGFNIGGIPEMVRPGETGWLAEKTNSDSLLSTIIAALDEVDDVETARYYRQRCRDIALNEYSLLIQGTRYRNLFASTISQFAQ